MQNRIRAVRGTQTSHKIIVLSNYVQQPQHSSCSDTSETAERVPTPAEIDRYCKH